MTLHLSFLSVPLGLPKNSYVNWCTGSTKSPTKQICFFLILMLSGDIQCNPGPQCMVCENHIQDDHQVLHCQECGKFGPHKL